MTSTGASDFASGISTTTLFSNLLEQSRKLRQETEAADLPAIQLGLGELERRAKDLRRGAQTTDARARYLLQAGGINLAENLRELDDLDFNTTYEPAVSSAPVDSDLDSYLHARQQQNVASSIEDSMRRTARDFDAFVAKNVELNWEDQKLRIFDHFGLAKPSAANSPVGGGNSGAADFRKSGFGRSRLGTSMGPNGNIGNPYGDIRGTSVWAKSTMGNSVLGKSMGPGRQSMMGSIHAGNSGDSVLNKPSATASLFGDIDPDRQLEMSRQVQQRQQDYAEAVKDMNETRLKSRPGQVYPVMKVFGDITEKSGNDMLTVQLLDSWRLLGNIVGEAEGGDTTLGGAKEREFLRDYCLNTTPNSPEASRMRRKIEKGSRRFLEKLFYTHVHNTLAQHPQIARIGGRPSVFAKFRGYINIKMHQNMDNPDWQRDNLDYLEDTPCWAMIFFLLRAGLLNDANTYVRDHAQQFSKMDRKFPSYVQAYCREENDRRLPKNLHDAIQAEYNNRIRHMADGKDMFRPAVYKLLGRCELAKRSMPNVMPTAEDWMWLQLVLSREVDPTSEPAHEVFTLTDLQKNITQYGAKHFTQKTANFGLYFQMLLMCGLFEDAVHYLYSFDVVDGVHFAIALTYYGLLKPTDDPVKKHSDLLTSNPKQLNFPRLIGYYTQTFRTPSVSLSIDYLALLCLNGDLPDPVGKTHLQLCHDALRELVLDTREFTQLLGNVRPDGTREPGAIEHRLKLINIKNQRDFLRTITEQAALQADQDGRPSDAVLLYHLAEDYNTVIEILCKNLAAYISRDGPAKKARDEAAQQRTYDQAQNGDSLSAIDNPELLAQQVTNMYSSNLAIQDKILPKNAATCGTLLQICNAQTLNANGHYEACLKTIDDLDVLPISLPCDMRKVRYVAQNFGAMHETIARNVGTLLTMAVDCCLKLTEQIQSQQYDDPTRRQVLADLQSRLSAVRAYVGMIQYKLPTDVYNYLNGSGIME